MPSQPPFVPIVIGRDVKRMTFPTPTGPIEGYQLRFQLATSSPDGTVVESWTEWLHLPNPLMVFLVESLDEFMRIEGHLAAQGAIPDPRDSPGHSE